MKGCLFLRNVGFHVSVCKCNLWRNQRMNHDFSNCYLIDVDIQKCLDTHFISHQISSNVCLFFGGFWSHSRSFHSYGDAIITDERLQMLTYARHSCLLSIEVSLTCLTYCDTEHRFIMVISEDP